MVFRVFVLFFHRLFKVEVVSVVIGQGKGDVLFYLMKEKSLFSKILAIFFSSINEIYPQKKETEIKLFFFRRVELHFIMQQPCLAQLEVIFLTSPVKIHHSLFHP